MSSPTTADHPVVFFDGLCNFCNRSVQLLIRLDPERRLRYASLQGEFGRRTVSMSPVQDNAMLLWENNTLHAGYVAVMRLGLILGLPGRVLYRNAHWPLLSVPGSFLYRIIARNRYFFGQRSSCIVPDASIRALFYD